MAVTAVLGGQWGDEAKGKIAGVYSISDLEETIRNFNPRDRKVVHRPDISEAIRNYLEDVFS